MILRQRFSIWLVVSLFFVWILPLGAFNKPSRVKFRCGGQRAICLCLHMKAKNKANTSQVSVGMNNSGNNEETNRAAGSMSHYCLISAIHAQKILRSIILRDSSFIIYRSLFVRLIEHVPLISILFKCF